MSTSAKLWRRVFPAGLLLAGLCVLGAASHAAAQYGGKDAAPLAGNGIATKFTNKRNFKLPVSHLSAADRSRLKNLYLYCRTPTSDWIRCDMIDPKAEHFVYRAKEDGEFLFAVVSQDNNGKVFPPPEEMRANLRVFIDTRTPTIHIEDQQLPEGWMFQCTMQARYPDQDSLRLICRNASGVEKTIEPLPNRPGSFLIRPQLDGRPQRVIGFDLCKNSAVQELFLDKPTAGATAGQAGPIPSPGDSWRGKETMAQANSSPLPSIPPLPQINPSPAQGNPPVPLDIRNDNPPFDARPANPSSGDSGTGRAPLSGASSITPHPMPTDLNPSASSKIGLPDGNLTILPTSQAFVEYRVDQLGTSGLGKVQVYITGDQGQSWTLLKEDHSKHSPVEIRLPPGDGVFGIALVTTNGLGFGGNAPRPGDPPACLIEVDTTRPHVQLQPPEILPDGAGLELRWAAKDKNMAAEPITLYYRTGPGGPWQPIARNMKNDGHYRWAFPRNVGPQFYFKIEAVDQVGNMGSSETPNALTLDMTVPQAVVIRVSGTKQN